MTPDELAEQIRFRSLVDSLQEATACYWERRADTIEAAAPRPGDFTGHADPDTVRARADRIHEDAAVCRFHAGLLRELYQDAAYARGVAA